MCLSKDTTALIMNCISALLFFRYCESRRNVLLDHVREGYDRELWEYQEEL